MPATSANNPNLETTIINKRFMSDLTLQLQTAQFCSPPDTQALYQGDTVRWLHFPEWTVDKTALSQTTVTDNNVSISGALGTDDGTGAQSVEATMAPYGAYVQLSNFLIDTAPVGMMRKTAKRAADAGARALDELAYAQGILSSVTHKADQDTVGQGTMGSSADTARARDFAAMRAYFVASGVQGFDFIDGEYGSVIHPEASKHLQTETSTSGIVWADVNKYIPGMDGQKKILKGENGTLSNIRIFESPIVAASSVNSVNAYKNLVLGHDGLGCTQIRAANKNARTAGARVLIKRAADSGTYQPTETFDTVAWKWVGAFKLLDSKRVILYYSATGV
jgi:N4-gp56 family major capsid protein